MTSLLESANALPAIAALLTFLVAVGVWALISDEG